MIAKDKKGFWKILSAILILTVGSFPCTAFGKSVETGTILKFGAEGNGVKELQKRLKSLKLFEGEISGYFGEQTRNSLMLYQKKNGLVEDGIMGNQTHKLLYDVKSSKSDKTSTNIQSAKNVQRAQNTFIAKATIPTKVNTTAKNALPAKNSLPAKDTLTAKNTLTTKNNTATKVQKATIKNVSRGLKEYKDTAMKWFDGIENIFSRDTYAIVKDIDTGMYFSVKRTGGTNHADTETVSSADTSKLMSIFDGKLSWERRAVVVYVGNYVLGGSLSGTPHAGREDRPGGIPVNGRSAGYGYGINFDSVKGNNMSGHFDIHFLGSKTHGTNKVDSEHQEMVRKALKYISSN